MADMRYGVNAPGSTSGSGGSGMTAYLMRMGMSKRAATGVLFAMVILAIVIAYVAPRKIGNPEVPQQDPERAYIAPAIGEGAR